MDIARTLHPHAAIAIRITSLTVAGVWVFFLGLKAYCIAFWPEHRMLQATAAEAIKGTAVLSSMFGSPFMAAWLLLRRVSWHVDSKGISVHHGEKLKRSLPWPNIIELRMFPHYIVIRCRPRPSGYELLFLTAEEVSWVRKFAGEHLGDRLVDWTARRRGSKYR